jgi:hypothetical protein
MDESSFLDEDSRVRRFEGEGATPADADATGVIIVHDVGPLQQRVGAGILVGDTAQQVRTSASLIFLLPPLQSFEHPVLQGTIVLSFAAGRGEVHLCHRQGDGHRREKCCTLLPLHQRELAPNLTRIQSPSPP